MSPRIAISLVAALLAAAPAPMPLRADDENDVAVLSEKVRKLEEEVINLRRRLVELGKQQPVPLVLAPAAPETPPPGWIPREFNGQRYYAVPLDR